MPEMSSPPLCAAPWTHLYVDVDGLVYLCCFNERSAPLGNISTDTLQEIWNSNQLKAVRTGFKQDCFTENQCWRCREGLRQGIPKSALLMAEFEQFYRARNPTLSTKAGPLYLNIHLGNLCNLKCVMCSAKYSSQHAGFVSDPYAGNDKFDASFKIALDTLEFVNFGGGEPLINPNLYRYLSMVRESAQPVAVSYITNLSVVSPELRNIMGKLLGNSFRISIDGVGQRYEKIRRGAKWKTVCGNLEHLAENRAKYRIRGLHVLMCVFNNNYQDIDPLLDLCRRLKLTLGFHAVYDPEPLSPFKSPPVVRDRMREYFSDLFVRRKDDMDELCPNGELLRAI